MIRYVLPCLLCVTAVTLGEDRPGFLRGIGWSPWHATYRWARPPEVVEQDFANLRDLHVNALRTWRPMERSVADACWAQGLYVIPQLGEAEGLPRMQFKDGTEDRHPVYTAPESVADLRAQAVKLATELKGHPALAAYNLGNEYNWIGRNKAGQYQSLGFDQATLDAFRSCLKERFGTIAQWRKLTGQTDADFAAIVPPTNVGKDLLYWEWWRFQREAFGRFLREGHEAIREVDSDAPVTYALLCGARYNPATEDADVPFLDWQGHNLYYHSSKDWAGYCERLTRRIGPGRPIVVTETGINTWMFKDPAVAARLMRQMLWILILHPEVRGIFPFCYCDAWWHGPDPNKQDDSEDAWGVFTADRQPKCTYEPLKETYAEFQRLDEFLSTRRAPVELLVTDQVIDWWRGATGPEVGSICRELYRRGVSFRLISLLRPQDLSATDCDRLLLLDSTIPDEPDGTSPARDALVAFAQRGGRILCINDKPFRGMYLPDGRPRGLRANVVPAKVEPWTAILSFLGKPNVEVDAGDAEIFWRRLRGAGQDTLLLVATGPKPVPSVTIRGALVVEQISADGSRIQVTGKTCRLDEFNTYALLRLGDENPSVVRTWKDSTGQYSVQAEFVECSNGIVKLKRTDDGRVLSLRVQQLCEEDQQWIRARQK